MSGLDRLTDEQIDALGRNDDNAMDRVHVDQIAWLARELLAHRRASQAAPAPQEEACPCCGGTGSYGDACVRAINGTAPAASDGLREAANTALNEARNKIAERRNACPPGPLFGAFNEAMGDIEDVRFALAKIEQERAPDP